MKASVAVATSLVAVVAFGGLLAWVARTPHTPPAVTNTPPREPPVAPPPSEFERQMPGLPEPNASAAFVFDGDVEYDSSIPAGRLKITAAPGEFEGARAWFVEEEEEVPALPGPGTPATSERRKMWLSRGLRVLATQTVTKSAGVTVTASATVGESKVTTTVDGRQPETTTYTRGVEGARPLAAALLYFRMCPAEVTTRGDEAPPPFPAIWQIDPDGSLHCTAMADSCDAHITLRGTRREPVRIERYIGWHNMGTIVAREPK